MIRIPLRIARTETRRSLRVATGDRTKLLLNMVIMLFALGPLTAIGVLLLPTAGEFVASGEVGEIGGVTATDVASGGVALVWVFLFGVATVRTVTTVANVDEPACLLISTRLQNVVQGLICKELVLYAIWLLPPMLLLSGAFAYGYGSIIPVLLVFVVIGLVFLTTVPLGFVPGIWIRHILTTYEPIAKYRTVLLIGVAALYIGAIATDRFNDIMAWLFYMLTDSPFGWPGHILLVAVPGVSPSVMALGGALAGSVLVPVIASKTGTASAERHWFADSVRTGESTVESDTSNRLTNLLSVGFDRPVQTVAVTAIRRTKRSPIRLVYVAYPLFASVFFIDDIIQTGTLPSYAAILLCIYVIWAAGALFTLNPIGESGSVLPAVLTSTVDGRSLMSGLVLAGMLVSVPVAILVSFLAGVVSPLSVGQTILLVIGTFIGSTATPALAVGVGTLFPRYGSVRVSSNREAVMPSKTAFLVYTLAIALPLAGVAVLNVETAPDLIATGVSVVITLLPTIEFTVSATVVSAVAWIVVPLGLVAPFVSFLYASRQFNQLTIE